MKNSLFTAALILGAFALSAAAQPSAPNDAPARAESAPNAGTAPTAGDHTALPPRPSAEALVQRQDALLQQMAELDNSAPDFRTRLGEIGAELRLIQDELQKIDRGAAGPNGNSFRPEPFAPVDRTDAAAPSAVVPPAPAADPGSGAVPFPASTAAQPIDAPPFSPFAAMDADTMRRTRADLITQLKLLNRTLETLGSEDEALAESLTEQQRELNARIKELDERIGSPAPQTQVSAAEKTPFDAAPTGDGPAADPNGPGLNPAEIDRIDAMFGGTPTPAADPTEVDGAWYSGENKNQKILDAVAELKKSNDETNRRLDEVLDELKTIETQLKLLSRQAVIEK